MGYFKNHTIEVAEGVSTKFGMDFDETMNTLTDSEKAFSSLLLEAYYLYFVSDWDDEAFALASWLMSEVVNAYQNESLNGSEYLTLYYLITNLMNGIQDRLSNEKGETND